MADRYIVTTHVRRFQVDGDAAWIRAARAQQAADEARRRAAASVRDEMVRGAAAAPRGVRAMEQSGRAALATARDNRRLAGSYDALTSAQMRAATREGQLLERANVARRRAFQQEQALVRQRQALAARQANLAARQSTAAAAAPVTRTRPAPAGFSIGPGLLGVGLAGYATAGILRQGKEYEAAVRDAGVAAELTGPKLARLGKIGRQVGLETAAGATEATKAAGEMAKAGVSLEAIATGALQATVELARAGDTDIPSAATAMSKALSIFSLEGSKAAHVADLIAGSSLMTTDSVEGVIEGFTNGASAARDMGWSIEQTIVALTLLAQKGNEGAEGGTALKSALLRLVDPPKAAADAIEKYNLKLFDQKGSLRSVAELSDELNTKLGGLTNRQQSAALKALAGSYGYRALSAVMSKSSSEVQALEKHLNRQGVAAEQAAGRTAKLEGAQRKLAAAREDAAIDITQALTPGLTSAADSLTGVLRDPSVKAQLRNFGDQLGDSAARLADGFEAAASDGRLEDALHSALIAASAVEDAAKAAGSAVGALSKAWAAVPGPIRESAVQALVFTAIMRRLIAVAPAGLLATRGQAAGGAAAATSSAATPLVAGVAGGAAAQRLSVREMLARRSELAAQQATARAAQQAAAQRVAAAQVAGAGTFGATQRGIAAAQVRAAEAERARIARAATLADRERAALTRNYARQVMPSGRAVGTSAAVGAGAVALSGGDLKTAIPTAAIVGAGLGGPWGAAGAVIATAAGAGLVAYFKGKGKKELGEALADVRDGPGQNVSDKAQRELAEAKRKYDKARAADYVGDGRGGLVPKLQRNPASVAAERNYGRLAGQAQARENVKGREITPSLAVASFISENKKLTPEARKAAAAPWLAAIAEAESKGKAARGTTMRFARQVGAALPDGLRESLTAGARQIKQDKSLEQAAGSQLKQVRKTLSGQEGTFQGLTKATDTSWKSVVKTTQQRIGELKAISQDVGGSTAKTRAKASAEYHKLERDLADLIKKAGGVPGALSDIIPADTIGRDVDLVTAKIDALREKLRELGASSSEISAALRASAEVGSVPEKRRGGPIKAFGSGGELVAVSSGEAMRYPDGSWAMVPGQRVAADNVITWAPYGAEVYTDHGQQLLEAGASRAQALALQLPHFAGGGSIGPSRASQALRSAGFNGTPLVRMTAIAGAESRYVPGAVSPPNDDPWRSRDHGLTQVNDHWHPEYFKQPGRIYEPGYNARAAWAISNHGTNFDPWSTWRSGAWRAYEAGARSAATKTSGGGGEFGDQDVTVPLTLGRSKTGRGELVAGSFGAGLQLGQSGYSSEDLRRFGRPVLGEISSALASGTYTRTVTARGGGSDESQYAAGKGGSTTFHGKPVASWMIPSLTYASKHGWSGVISSGLRTNAEQTQLYNEFKAGKRRGPVAQPGKSNHEGTVYPKGAIDTPDWQGLRRALAGYSGRKPKWFGPGDAVHFSGTGRRRGGPIRGFAAGGKVSSVGDVNVAAGIGRGGADFYQRLAQAADDAAYARVERVIGQLRAVATAGGDSRVVARARAAMSALENALGVRVGQMIGRASQALDARTQNLRATAAIQKIQGIDPSSIAGLQGQKLVEQRLLNEAPARQRELEAAVRRAERGDLRSKAGRENLDTARDALKEFRMQVLEARGNIKEYDRAIAASAAEQARAAAEAAAAAREAAFTNLDTAASAHAAWAALTTSTLDDASAQNYSAQNLRRRAQAAFEGGDTANQGLYDAQAAAADVEAERLRRRNGLVEAQSTLALAELGGNKDAIKAANESIAAIYRAGLESAKASLDTVDVTELATGLKGVEDAIKAGNSDKEDATKALADATKQLADEKAQLRRAVEAQDPLALMAAALSGAIGGEAIATSGYPGGLRY